MKATKDFYKSWHDETSKMYQQVQDDEAVMTDEDRKADKARKTYETYPDSIPEKEVCTSSENGIRIR